MPLSPTPPKGRAELAPVSGRDPDVGVSLARREVGRRPHVGDALAVGRELRVADAHGKQEVLELHRACGREAAKAGLELVIAVQGQAKEILQGAAASGMDRSRLKFVADAVEAGELLARTVRKGDVVLMKGSRGVKLEQAINTLRAQFASMEP